ncbi:DUF308 domain-containing protein [Candidatus Saccharibacteria bacterium]|nr:DUF308 domain-containing protein [Candidatus Saccharibacteria bacterium]
MQKTVKKFLDLSIFGSVVAIVLGILFLVFPIESLDVIRWIIAIITFVIGTTIIIGELTRRGAGPIFGVTAIGAIFMVIGLVFATRPAAMNVFSIVLGAWFIVTAVSAARYDAALSGSAAYVSGLMSLISMAVGILLIINPWGGSVSMMIVLGVGLIVFGISSAINVYVLKNNLKDIAKKLGLKK